MIIPECSLMFAVFAYISTHVAAAVFSEYSQMSFSVKSYGVQNSDFLDSWLMKYKMYTWCLEYPQENVTPKNHVIEVLGFNQQLN